MAPNIFTKIKNLIIQSIFSTSVCMLLGGSAKTLMFVHISPEADTLGEAISTLKFAERVGSVELGAARVNKDNSEVKELKEQVSKPYLFVVS